MSLRGSVDRVGSLRDIQAQRRKTLALLLVLMLAALLFTDTIWRARAPIFYENIEYAGTFLIFICIIGRTWCTLYIGGRKLGELVQDGPYSLARNPLYLFSLIGAAGIGAQSGSLMLSAAVAVVAACVFIPLVRREEAALQNLFGERFNAYVKRVPRFIPDFANWRDVERLEIKPALVARTFVEATLFLLAIPIADIIEEAQSLGWLKVLLWLP